MFRWVAEWSGGVGGSSQRGGGEAGRPYPLFQRDRSSLPRMAHRQRAARSGEMADPAGKAGRTRADSPRSERETTNKKTRKSWWLWSRPTRTNPQLQPRADSPHRPHCYSAPDPQPHFFQPFSPNGGASRVVLERTWKKDLEDETWQPSRQALTSATRDPESACYLCCRRIPSPISISAVWRRTFAWSSRLRRFHLRTFACPSTRPPGHAPSSVRRAPPKKVL